MVKEEIQEFSKEEQKLAKKTIGDLLKLLSVDDKFEISFSEKTIDLSLDTEDKGIMIGYHGEILDSLQLVFSLCVSKKIGRFVHVSMDVGDYKKNRMDFLKNITLQTKERVVLEKIELPLPNLKPWERRFVHMLLQGDEEVVSESVGEGQLRTLVIKPKV